MCIRDSHSAAPDQNSVPGIVVHTGPHVIQILSRPGNEHQRHMNEDEKQKPAQHAKVDGAGRLPIENSREPAELVGDRRTLHQAGNNRQRGSNEHRDEIGKLLQAVVSRPAMLDGKLQRQILKRRREGAGENCPGCRHQSLPLVRREQQNVKNCAVDYP